MSHIHVGTKIRKHSQNKRNIIGQKKYNRKTFIQTPSVILNDDVTIIDVRTKKWCGKGSMSRQMTHKGRLEIQSMENHNEKHNENDSNRIEGFDMWSNIQIILDDSMKSVKYPKKYSTLKYQGGYTHEQCFLLVHISSFDSVFSFVRDFFGSLSFWHLYYILFILLSLVKFVTNSWSLFHFVLVTSNKVEWWENLPNKFFFWVNNFCVIFYTRYRKPKGYLLFLFVHLLPDVM